LSLGDGFILGYNWSKSDNYACEALMYLLDIREGIWVKVKGFSGGRGMQEKLTQRGLYPGDCVRVLRIAPLGGPLLVEVNGREIALGRGVAQKILVEQGTCG
jgi:ferrous iron transport protein A